MFPRRFRYAPVVLLVATVCFPAWAPAGESFAGKVLKAQTLDDKGLAAVKGRKRGIDAANVMAIVTREKSNEIAALVTGMHFEKGSFESGRSPAVLRAFASRKGLHPKATVMAALSPHAEKLIGELVESSSNKDRLLAAAALATYSRASSIAKENVRGGKGRQLANFKMKPLIEDLLEDRSAQILEYALLAAAYGRMKSLEETVENFDVGGSEKLAAARLLYVARTGGELPEKQTRYLLKSRMRTGRRFLGLSPLLNSYDVRGNELIYACQAVKEARDNRFIKELKSQFDHKDIRVRIDAIKAIEQVGDEDCIPLLLEKLDPETKAPWPVKIAALSALGAIPAMDSIDPLVDFYKNETGRLRQDAAYALISIIPELADQHYTGRLDWLATNRDDIKIDRKATKKFRQTHLVQDIEVPPLTQFYGVGIISDRAVFVLDTSKSMRGDKIASLKETMTQMLGNLPKEMHFNVVDFGGIISVMKPGTLLPAKAAPSAIGLVQYMSLTLGTRTFDAMETGERLPRADTIVYLSDGSPIAGQFQSWDRIAYAFDAYNRYRPIAIQCIYYSKGGKAGKAKQQAKAGRNKIGGMKRLVERHTGKLYLSGGNGQPAEEL